MTIHLSFLLWLPALVGLVAVFLPRRIAGWLGFVGSLGALAYAVALVVDFESGGGLQHVTDKVWISELGIHYKLGVDGLNLWLILLTALLFAGSFLWIVVRRMERAGGEQRQQAGGQGEEQDDGERDVVHQPFSRK